MSEKDRIPELFGSMSFNEGTMEQYVPHQAMEVWRDVPEKRQAAAADRRQRHRRRP